MGKYLFLWEIDQDKIPMDPKERADGYLVLLSLIRQDLEKGRMTDWGTFVGMNAGYAVAEGSEVEIGLFVNQYIPVVTFKTYQVASVDHIEELLKTMAGR